MTTTTPNYYRILDLEDKQYALRLPSQDVKQAYKRALLRHHPDKQQSQQSDASDRPSLRAVPSTTIDNIAAAFQVLSDPVLRADYDRKLRTAAGESLDSVARVHGHHTGLDTVDLDELDYDEELGEWHRSCRCGNEPAFIVTEAELELHVEERELVVGCKGCSLWLKVLFSAEG